LTRSGGFSFAQPGRSTEAMNSLQTLQSLGISLPSPAYIFGVVLFGLIGIALYRYAKRAGRRRGKWLAVALMLYPYAVSQTWLLYAVGVALCVGVALDRG
jgi:surface polysaccharide O-acyltransferase-like enzyme